MLNFLGALAGGLAAGAITLLPIVRTEQGSRMRLIAIVAAAFTAVLIFALMLMD